MTRTKAEILLRSLYLHQKKLIRKAKIGFYIEHDCKCSFITYLKQQDLGYELSTKCFGGLLLVKAKRKKV